MSMQYQATVTAAAATALIYTGPGLLFGLQLGTDSTNDPTITVYDNITNSGTELLPTTIYEADYQGLNGFCCSYGKKFIIGLYIEITCAGSVAVALDWRAL